MFEPSSELFFKILANQFHLDDATLQHFIPKDETEADLPTITYNDPTFALKTPAQWLERIHYSWLESAVANLPPHLQPSLLASLPIHQQRPLRLKLGLAVAPAPSPPAKRYLLRLLYDLLNLDKAPPLELLTESPFNALCAWDKSRLIQLCHLLGILDLKEKVRHIVDKKLLRQIYAALDRDSLLFLRTSLKTRERISSTALNLESWDGSPNVLKQLLQQRGLIRLGTALHGEQPELLWHLSHLLDKGRSAILMRHYHGDANDTIQQVLKEQLLNTVAYINQQDNHAQK